MVKMISNMVDYARNHPYKTAAIATGVAVTGTLSAVYLKASYAAAISSAFTCEGNRCFRPNFGERARFAHNEGFQAVKDTLNNAYTTAASAAAGAADAASSAGASVKDGFNTAYTATAEAASRAGASVKDGFNATYEATTSAVSRAGSFILSGMKTAYSSVSNAFKATAHSA